MKYSNANTLVIRRTFNTLKDSVWTDLQWACNKLCVSHLWKFSKSPLEAEYIPTGQKILFRGLDNPLSITSITVSKGILFTLSSETIEPFFPVPVPSIDVPPTAVFV